MLHGIPQRHTGLSAHGGLGGGVVVLRRHMAVHAIGAIVALVDAVYDAAEGVLVRLASCLRNVAVETLVDGRFGSLRVGYGHMFSGHVRYRFGKIIMTAAASFFVGVQPVGVVRYVLLGTIGFRFSLLGGSYVLRRRPLNERTVGEFFHHRVHRIRFDDVRHGDGPGIRYRIGGFACLRCTACDG